MVDWGSSTMSRPAAGSRPLDTPPNRPPTRTAMMTRGSNDSGYHSGGGGPAQSLLIQEVVSPSSRISRAGGVSASKGSVEKDLAAREQIHPCMIDDQDQTIGILELGTTKKIHPYTIDDQISENIKMSLPDTDRNDTKGIPYVFTVFIKDAFPETVVKVGRTTQTINERMNQLTSDHNKKWEYTLTPGVDTTPIHHHLRVEGLVHKELANNVAYKSSCPGCSKGGHKEYFNVPKDVAIASVKRWRRFCAREPYDNEGKLLPFWARRLERRALPRDGERADDHAARGERWDRFIDVTWMDYWLYDIECFIRRARTSPLRWQWCSLVQALVSLLLPGALGQMLSLLIVGYLFLEQSALGREVARYVNALVDINQPQEDAEGQGEESEPPSQTPLPSWVLELAPGDWLQTLSPSWLPSYLSQERPRWLDIALSDGHFDEAKRMAKDVRAWWKGEGPEIVTSLDTSLRAFWPALGHADVQLLETLLVAFVLSRAFHFVLFLVVLRFAVFRPLREFFRVSGL